VGRAAQRVSLAIAFSLVVVWGMCYGLRGSGALRIAERVDPNRACAASLMRLPGIGPSRAAAICARRAELHAAGTAFQRACDLETVPGIGPKTVEAIRPWIELPPAASEPAGSDNKDGRLAD
jgi:competence ComEA-like helix-hairpin-helix protein